MARLKINLPEKFIFATEITVRIGDINHGGHLGHESFIILMEEARARFLESIGYSEAIVDGLGFIMADIGVVYRGQGYYGQTVRVDIGVTDFTSKGFDIIYRLSDAPTGAELALAKTGHVLYDYRQQKAITLPPDFREKCTAG